MDHKVGPTPYESWTMLKNWCFQTVVVKTLESPLDRKRSIQSILKEINPDYSLEGHKLKLQYLGHLMQRVDSLERPWCWERLKAIGEEGWQRMRWLYSTTDSMDMSLSKLWETVEEWGAWHTIIHGVAKSCMIQQLNSNNRIWIISFQKLELN